MNSEKIPFNKHVGLINSKRDGFYLELPEADKYHNHLGTVHASAQFTLAEATSGEFLIQTFPDLIGKTIPVVRDVSVKYRKPGRGRLFARVDCDKKDLDKVRLDLERRGLVRLKISVTIVDIHDVVTMKAKVEWIIQNLEGN